MSEKIIPVILCGGSGTRLWPASREKHPKQFLKLINDYSLLQNTALRAMSVAKVTADKLVTVTLGTLADEVAAQLSELDPAAARHILREPSARNTAAAVAFAASYISRVFGPDSYMLILPADHHIGNEEALTVAVGHALHAAKNNYLTTFGIHPHRPETGYGYIHVGDMFSWGAAHETRAFVEKPDAQTAQGFIEAKNYLWNSGMFLFSTNTLMEEYATHAADILKQVEAAIEHTRTPSEAAEHLYAEIPDQPFDKAIMEKSTRVAIVPCDPEWSDIGSWESLWEMHPKDGRGNVIKGQAACQETSNCLIHAQTRLIACVGLENIVVIETPDALLIADRSNSDAMRKLVKTLKSAERAEISEKPGIRKAWTIPTPAANLASTPQMQTPRQTSQGRA
jgi:mannose-1-phosphate guanylyltransferase/mannose-6-phosphate isomerase